MKKAMVPGEYYKKVIRERNDLETEVYELNCVIKKLKDEEAETFEEKIAQSSKDAHDEAKRLARGWREQAAISIAEKYKNPKG